MNAGINGMTSYLYNHKTNWTPIASKASEIVVTKKPAVNNFRWIVYPYFRLWSYIPPLDIKVNIMH
jgi:hypothetical protein